MNQYFPNDLSMILQKHGWVEDPFKVQDRPMEHENFIDNVFRFYVATNFKKLPVEF